MKTQSKITMLAMALLIGSMAFQSCEKHDDNHQHTDEGELITKVEILLIDTISKDTLFTLWSDMDGIGGNNPNMPDTLNLKQGKTYVGLTRFYTNHDAISFHDINQEIKDEGENHLLCFDVNSMTMPPNAGITITRADKDKNGLELGLETMWKMNRTDIGSVKVRLKHQPGIKKGNCDPGETDVEVDFPFVITN
jgi:hypothetical protein